MIEVRRISNTQIDGVSLFVVFYNGTCKKVYARDEKEAEEKVRMSVENVATENHTEKDERNMSETPRSINHCDCGADKSHCFDCLFEVSCQLERENAELRELLRIADELIDEYAEVVEHCDNVDEMREQIKAALAAESGRKRK